MTALFALHGADLPPTVLRKLTTFLESLPTSEACREVLEKAVEWEVEDRWSTVAELCAALRKALKPVETDGVAQISARLRVNEKDGSALVFVPGGKYVLGATDIDDDSRPVHSVELSPFWIGRTLRLQDQSPGK